jgi:predicted amidophosphoribosyltransferase
VPLARSRRAARGYDQARALAAALATRIGLPAVELLVRPRAGTPQASRGGAERRRAMSGAFGRAAATPPSRVLLVDDVLTTGATAAACADVLMRAGASEVGLLTAARAMPGALPARYTRRGLPSGSVVARERGVSGSRCQPRAKRPT